MNSHKLILGFSIIGILVTACAFLVALYKNIPIIAILAVVGNISVVVTALISIICMADEDE